MALKYRFNLKDIKLQDFKVYLVAMFKGILPKKKIKNIEDLREFIQQKSAWVSQVTLYNYLKTRMGTKWVLHFDDETFLKSMTYEMFCTIHVMVRLSEQDNTTHHSTCTQKNTGLQNEFQTQLFCMAMANQMFF